MPLQQARAQHKSLWVKAVAVPGAGVPCVTLVGSCHAHNVGASLLTAVGLTEDWVARTEDEYVGMALRAASNVTVSISSPQSYNHSQFAGVQTRTLPR